MPKTMKWYRVAFAVDGAVESVQQVQDTGPQGQTIVYVQATSEDAAKAAATRLRQRDANRARRARYRGQGLCDCGRAREATGVHCHICLKGKHAAGKRRKAEERGEVVPSLPPKSVAYASREQEKRLAVLCEVYHAWQNCTTNGAFTKWMKDAMADAAPPKFPALRAVGSRTK